MGSIRITSGHFRGRTIQAPPGETTRPLLTRVRKSLADILRPRLPGALVIDLFGGSGAIALELLSNGAARAVAIELDPEAAALIRENAFRLGADLEVLEGDALQAIPRLSEAGRRFDVVVVAPPYGHGLQQKALELLEAAPLLTPGGVVVVQRDRDEPALSLPETATLRLLRSRRYGRTILEFYEPAA